MNSGFIELTEIIDHLDHSRKIKIRVAIDQIIVFRPNFNMEDEKECGTTIYTTSSKRYSDCYVLNVEESYRDVSDRINRALEKTREVYKK